MTDARWDYVFLLSNEPVPALVEKVQCAVAAERRVVVVYMSRPWAPVQMDSLTGATVIRIPVDFKSVGIGRFASFLGTLRLLRRDVFTYAADGCDVYTDSVDLLAMAQLAGRGRRLVHRFEVRDLHPLQMGRSPVARVLQLIERVLLRRVAVLVLTSRAHFTRYYDGRFAGDVVYVENIPARAPWVGFRRAPSEQFIVGFIGVLRYRQSLEALIAAVKRLHSSGLNVHLRIAGGGVLDDLKDMARDSGCVTFEGPFRYGEAAQRLHADLAIINSVYDADSENVRLAVSNKFYEAQITGVPLLVAENTYLATLVREAEIGTAVRYDDVDHVASVLADAYHGGKWYRSAQQRLADVDVDALFSRHEAELLAAVLMPASRARTGETPRLEVERGTLPDEARRPASP